MAGDDGRKANGSDSIGDVVDELIDKLKTNGKEAVSGFLELEAQLVSQYRDHLVSLRASHDSLQREYARLVVRMLGNAAEMQAQYRKSVGDTHDALLSAHVEFVERLRERLNRPSPPDRRTQTSKPPRREDSSEAS